jgi:hypothetical protein
MSFADDLGGEIYDRAGNPITLEEWGRLRENREYVVVEKTTVGDVEVSTVWLGLDHGIGRGREIFETMLFGEETGEEQHRYATEAEALDGHRRIVEELRVLARAVDPPS